MDKRIFKNKKINFSKLNECGFLKKGDSYFFVVPILDNQFEMQIQVSSDEVLKIKTIEEATQEEYTLHLTDAVGGFVGAVRNEYEKVLQDISDKCYDMNVFRSKQTLEIIAYISKRYGDDLEYLWSKFPDNAIWRRKDNKKWYGLLMLVSKRKLKIDNDEKVEVIDLRADEEEIKNLVDHKSIFEGYHMNKKHWITICLDNSVDTKNIFELIDKSYILAKK